MADAEHWKQSYFNLRHTMQEWHAQAIAAGFDGVPDVLLVTAESAKLLAALNAMLTHFGMDEDEWNRPTFKQAKEAIAQYEAVRKKGAAGMSAEGGEAKSECVYPRCGCVVKLDGSWEGCAASPKAGESRTETGNV